MRSDSIRKRNKCANIHFKHIADMHIPKPNKSNAHTIISTQSTHIHTHTHRCRRTRKHTHDIHMLIRIRIHILIRIRIHVNMHLYTGTQARTPTRAHIQTRAHTYLGCMYAVRYVCVYACAQRYDCLKLCSVHIENCIWIYTYLFLQVHTCV